MRYTVNQKHPDDEEPENDRRSCGRRKQRTINVYEGTYAVLTRAMRPGESYDDVVRRLLAERHGTEHDFL